MLEGLLANVGGLVLAAANYEADHFPTYELRLADGFHVNVCAAQRGRAGSRSLCAGSPGQISRCRAVCHCLLAHVSVQ